MTRKMTFQLRIPTTSGEYIPNNTEPVELTVCDLIAVLIDYFRWYGFTEKPLTRAYKLTFTTQMGEIIINDISCPENITIRYGIERRGKMTNSESVELLHLHNIHPLSTTKGDVLVFTSLYGNTAGNNVHLPITCMERDIIDHVGNFYNPYLHLQGS